MFLPLLLFAAQAQPTPYHLIPDWPNPPRSAAGTPTTWNLIQVPGVTIDSAGHILVLHRGAHPILVFDASGKFLRSFGEGLFSEGKVVAVATSDRALGASAYSAVNGPAGCTACGAHAIRTDAHGNIWAVDAAAHVVYKLNPQGRVLMQLGTKGVSGLSPTHFNLPTDVAFAPNGDIYVSDGYGNPRVVKFTPNGRFILQWGKRGAGPGEFQLPHNIAVDAHGKVYVTDRDNRRVQVFDPTGKFIAQWTDTGGVSALYLTPNQQIWTGTVLRGLDGKPIASLPSQSGELASTHAITVSSKGDVYIGQLNGDVRKFSPSSTAAQIQFPPPDAPIAMHPPTTPPSPRPSPARLHPRPPSP